MTIRHHSAVPTHRGWAALFAVALALGMTVIFAPAQANADRKSTSDEIDSWKACYDQMTGFESASAADYDCCLKMNMKWTGGTWPSGHCDVTTITAQLSPSTAPTKSQVPTNAPKVPPVRSQP
ncbi:MAG: hypothetical protein QOH57_2693 [Mycobacterium sp.]|jgi:hypothetical protein|nr:hypothetical protein [Mycobacterium sp.]